MSDWETVSKLALSLPEVEASSRGRVAFSVRGKGFAWEARERDGGGLAVRVERVEDLGDSAIVNLKVGAQPLKLKTDRLPSLREGDDAFVDFAPDRAHLFDAAGGARLS